MDEEGFLYVVGRTKDMIKIGGNRVSAKEIEEALHEHPAIIEAAVIGVPDDVLGEAPKAFIVVKKGSSERLVGGAARFPAEALGRLQDPQALRDPGSLPKNESGKILKLKLKEPAQ